MFRRFGNDFVILIMKKLYLLILVTSIFTSAYAQGRERVVERESTQKPAKITLQPMKLDARQKLTAERLTAFFENSTIDFQYDYVENLDDGRGFTAGRIGFTTGTSDALVVVKKYTEVVPKNGLAKYIPELERLEDAEDRGDVSNLEGFDSAWKEAAADEKFRKIQDKLNDEMYFNPSQALADILNLKFPLSRAALYDACIQHGCGGSADSLSAMISKTNAAMKGSPKDGVDEANWLAKFLEIRENVLLNPENKETQAAWSESTDRVKVFINLLNQQNFILKLPMEITCYGDSVTIS
jgi:chitosanase